MNTEKRFTDLWTDYLEGELSDDGLAELRELMANDPSLVEMAADSLRTHRLLGMAGQEETWQQDTFVKETMAKLPVGDEEFVDDVMLRLPCCPEQKPMRKIGKRFWRLALTAAAAAAVTAITLFSMKSAPRIMARITAMSGSVQWTSGGGRVRHDLEVGAALYGGVMETLTHDSWVECTYLDGTKITISGRAMATLSEDDRQKIIHLREGSLSADVTPQPKGKPMRMITRTAEAEVLGTQFNVVSELQSTRLTVNKGLVQVRRLADGSTRKVPANHVIVAELEEETEFKPQLRKEFVTEWKASMTKDIWYGKRMPGRDGEPDSVRAKPMLWRGDDGKLKKPVLLHIVTIGTSTPTPLIEEDAFIRVRGRLARRGNVLFGFAAHHKKGGFAGKYFANRIIKGSDAGELFEVDIPLKSFRRHAGSKNYPSSPVNLELHECWVMTVQRDAGLEVTEYELHK